ncbi:cellulose-binding protein [Streptomyces sp. NPDC001544]|uniref:cellulose-binding protein n=1 Tax=Streptomyces sp. NPDC001544 TaxID=3364584 RepID=UPI00368A88D8
MRSAPVSPHGFVVVRGRGYRPGQVDAFTEALSRDRDAAWERAARLTVLAKDMAVEVARLRETVARLAPQTYEALGEGARRLFQLGVEEAQAVRESARAAARDEVSEAQAYAESVRRAAAEYADTLVGDVEERARQRLLAAGAEADEIRIGTRRAVKEGRSEALAALREMRQRTSGMLTEQTREHAARWAALEQEEVERSAALDALHAERTVRAQAALAEAERQLEEARASVGPCLEEAHARAAEILAEARVREDAIARETEQVLREHGETWDAMQTQMDDVRSNLATWTGRAVE